MGFGWFGLSTFWLLALCWPGVRGLLGGEIRIFGPGTLRMLLGVPLTMVSSATLAALTGGDNNTAGGSVGQSLAHGLHVALGGSLAMGVAGFLLLFSLPLVFGTTWWGMLVRGKSADDEDEDSVYEPRQSRESREPRDSREPVRGLSQMSFDTAEPAERGVRAERATSAFTPTLGQGHHNVGSLTEEPVPRRRGLAAQPRWKLSEEERARLDAMQPPPLTTRGAPRAEPSFSHGSGAAGVRPTGKGTSANRTGAGIVGAAGVTAAGASAASAAATPSAVAAGARAVLPRGAYASGNSRGDTLRMTEFVRSEPAMPPRDMRAASPAMARPAPSALGAPAPTHSVASDDPLHSTSIPGVTGYRRPVGTAPAHLRGTIVHSPFRKPQLGLEDMPPRGARPTQPRPGSVGVQPGASVNVSDVVATPTPTPASPVAASAAPISAPVARPSAPVMRGAASWSAADAATPLSSDVSDFSPIDWSVNDVPDASDALAAPVDVTPPVPTPEMLAQQEAARAAEQARIEALAVLRSEAEALLRDLRQWTLTDAAGDVDSSASTQAETPAPASATAPVPAASAIPAASDLVVRVAALAPALAPALATADTTTPATAIIAPHDDAAVRPQPVMPEANAAVVSTPVAPRAPIHAIDVPVLPPSFTAFARPATGVSGASPTPAHRPFVFADVLGSVEAFDTRGTKPVDERVRVEMSGAAEPTEVAEAVGVAKPSEAVEVIDATEPVEAVEAIDRSESIESVRTSAPVAASLDEAPPFDVDVSDDDGDDAHAGPAVSTYAGHLDSADSADSADPASKPHYVLRADGTWARADGAPLPEDFADLADGPAISAHVNEANTLTPSAPPTVPTIPSFTAASTAPMPAFGSAAFAPDASRAASFSADAPYELPPPRVAIDYDLPSVDLLSPATSQDVANVVSDEALAAVSQLIEQRLAEFKVPVTVVGASAGPVITRFEVEPAVGVRGAQVVGLMKDLARALGVTSIRVVETIPGRTCMGLELPNAQRQMIRLSEILTAPVFDSHRSHLALAMGKDITGEPVVADLARAPHLLVAGTTGSGKSVAVNAMILSLLYKATPDDVRLIMIDPKMLELSVYGGIPHLLAPVVTDMKQAAHALNWCVGEMEKRYRLMSALGVRNLAGYNEKIDAAHAAGRKVSNPFSLTPDAPEPLDRLPFIVVVIDELADLMMVAGKKIEELIARLAQKARAAGIHLVLATQRPSVDVITGLIKANIPTRVAFQVSSKIDSRTILDQMGAESLLGQGDMLFLPPGTGYPQRVHGAFVADDEVHRVVQHWQQYGEPDYDEAILAGDPGDAASADLFGESTGDAEADPLYDEAAAFVLNSRRASISAVQRQLRIGYNRAARLIEQMEAAGLVSPMGRNGTREVIAAGE